MSRPKISIIIALYNAKLYIEKCLDSVCDQTASKELYEVIIMDDGSADGSAGIADRYADQQPNARVFHKKNEGTYLCRLDGMRQARGEYVIFLDSDDWLENHAVEVLIKELSERPCDMLDYGIFDETADSTNIKFQLKESSYKRSEIARKLALHEISVELWHRMYAASVIQRHLTYFDTHYERKDFIGIRNEDEYLFPSLLRYVDTVRAIEVPLYHYREASAGSIMKEIDQDRKVKLRHAELLIHAGFLNLDQTKKDKELFGNFYYCQIQNLFYYIGCVMGCRDEEEIARLKEYFKNWKQYHYAIKQICIRDFAWYVKVMIRKMHLCYKYHRVIRMKAMERGSIG